MNPVLRVLELAMERGREGGAVIPEAVLEGLVQETGAQGGALRRGDELIAARGSSAPVTQRFELTPGRDSFRVEIVGGREIDHSLRVAATVVLGSWLTREELKRSRFSERRRLWEVESLRAIGEVLGGTLDRDQIAETLVLHATALLDARRGEVWFAGPSGWTPAARVAGAQAVAGCPDGTCSVAARIGGVVLSEDEARLLPESGLVDERRLAVPIAGQRGRIGVLAMADREVRGGLSSFTAADVETLTLYASQAAVALENATLHREVVKRELLERELELAATIQRQLLPAELAVPAGFDALAQSEPCRQVGGDVYDVVAAGDRCLLMVGDVAGKGVPAALMASSLHAAVHVLARTSADVGALAQEVHAHLLLTTPENKFATVFLAAVAQDGALEYVSAGHNPVFVIMPDGTLERLHSNAPPLGLLPAPEYRSARSVLPPGALLVVYTDGFTEALHPDGEEEFGEERLAKVLVGHRREPLDSLLSAAFAAVNEFTGGAPPHDDRTLLALRRRVD